MITCDYLIIGAGFAGIGLKYKLLGKTILIDKDPFKYKIGESHIPSLFNSDPGLFSLIPQIMTMKSYTRKLGSVFCDSYHGRYASSFPSSIGVSFACHCEREEIEKLLVKELSIEIRRETIVDIDLSKSLVTTDRNIYRFKKYILDCSGPAKVIANKLGLVSSLAPFEGMRAQWGYWAIDALNSDVDSWANWTVLNKVGADSWIWQIPLYQSSVLSMGLVHRGEALSKEGLIAYLEKRAAACYRLKSLALYPAKAVKPYMKEIHHRPHYSRVSKKCAGANWILVGDAYCFADPVFSVGSGVAMLQAITIANILNKNEGRFDYAWYEKNCNALLKTVIKGIGTWYSGKAFDKKVNKHVNRTILQGGFARHFRPSRFTEGARRLQEQGAEVFLPYVDQFARVSFDAGIKVYYFDESAFMKIRNSWHIISGGRPFRIANKAVQKVFEKHLISRKRSFFDLYLIAELKLSALKDKDYFWKLMRFIELTAPKDARGDRLYYFHPEKYENREGQLKLGDRGRHLVFHDPVAVEFFEKLKSKILFGKELITLANKMSSPVVSQGMKDFLKTFYKTEVFGENFCLMESDHEKVA